MTDVLGLSLFALSVCPAFYIHSYLLLDSCFIIPFLPANLEIIPSGFL